MSANRLSWSRIRVLVVDDHQLLRDGVAALLSREPDLVLGPIRGKQAGPLRWNRALDDAASRYSCSASRPVGNHAAKEPCFNGGVGPSGRHGRLLTGESPCPEPSVGSKSLR
jgi:hypothetical protein